MKNIALSFMVFKNCDFCSSVRNKKYFEKKSNFFCPYDGSQWALMIFELQCS